MERRGSVHKWTAWLLCSLAGGLLVMSIGGCQLTKIRKPQHNNQEFACGEPTPSGSARRSPPPAANSRENRANSYTSGSPESSSPIR